MKILKLAAKNVKRLTAVEITPEGSTVVIGGKNGAGKTSVLDSIMYALAGKAAVCDQPVRRGSAKAEIVCDLEEFVVKRTFTPTGGGGLTITASDGAKMASPQALLDKIVGKLTFDPLAFTTMKPKQQLDTLRSLVGLDLTEIEKRRKELYDERTMSGRDMTGRKNLIDGMEEYPDAPTEEVSVSALVQEVEDAENRNRGNEAKRRELADMERAAEEGRNTWHSRQADIAEQIEEHERAISRLKAVQPEELEAHLAIDETAKKNIAKAQKSVASLADADTDPLKERIACAEEINRNVRANEAKRDAEQRFLAAQAEYERLTGEIQALDNQKAEEIAKAEFPVEGLSLNETGVFLKDVPFAQAGSAEQLRVSVAMGLAMNPTLKIALIRDGSLLDKESLSMIGKMASEADAQVWIERVSDDGAGCQILIEDGHIKEG